MLTPFFPPIELSTWDRSVVGTKINFTPLKTVLAINPDKSPIVPPPIAMMQDFLSIFNFNNLLVISSKYFKDLIFSPPWIVIKLKFLFFFKAGTMDKRFSSIIIKFFCLLNFE